MFRLHRDSISNFQLFLLSSIHRDTSHCTETADNNAEKIMVHSQHKVRRGLQACNFEMKEIKSNFQ